MRGSQFTEAGGEGGRGIKGAPWSMPASDTPPPLTMFSQLPKVLQPPIHLHVPVFERDRKSSVTGCPCSTQRCSPAV